MSNADNSLQHYPAAFEWGKRACQVRISGDPRLAPFFIMLKKHGPQINEKICKKSSHIGLDVITMMPTAVFYKGVL